MTKKEINRAGVLRMLELMQTKEIKANYFYKKYEISRSTFQRDLEQLRNDFNYSVYWDSYKHCYINSGVEKGFYGYKVEIVRG